jgi:nucleoid DNA-binding protein
MDIDLLSKMVKELILDSDRVVLPGFGAFVAEIVPSTFSDKGYTINPPYRKLFFRMKPEEDTRLIEFYASSNDVELAVANKVIRDFVEELKSVLFTRKTVVFPGLGRLRATKENTVFFVADEDLDIYPEGFALEPISLKTHQETKEEIADAVAGLKAIVSEPVPEAEPVKEPAGEPEIPPVEAEPQAAEDPKPEAVENPEPAEDLETEVQ